MTETIWCSFEVSSTNGINHIFFPLASSRLFGQWYQKYLSWPVVNHDTIIAYISWLFRCQPTREIILRWSLPGKASRTADSENCCFHLYFTCEVIVMISPYYHIFSFNVWMLSHDYISVKLSTEWPLWAHRQCLSYFLEVLSDFWEQADMAQVTSQSIKQLPRADRQGPSDLWDSKVTSGSMQASPKWPPRAPNKLQEQVMPAQTQW